MNTGEQTDYQLLFESAPGLHLVLRPDLTIVGASRAYLVATMTERDSIVGRPLFEVFPDNPDDPAADGVRNLRASLDEVLSTGKSHRMETQKYDIRRPDGNFEVRYWSPMNKPVLDTKGKVRYIIHTVTDVTAQEVAKREGQASTRKAEQLLQSCIESLQDVLVYSVDSNYCITHYNTAFREATARAYGRHIEVGMNLLDCITNPDDREKVERNFRKAINGEQHVTIQEFGDLEKSYFETRYNPMYDENKEIMGLIVLTANITGRIKAEAERRRLASIVDSAVDAVIGRSLEGTVIIWNHGAERLFGYLASEAIGKDIAFLIDEIDLARESEILPRVLGGEVIENYETRRRRRDGTLIDVSLSVSPIKDEDGRVIGISKIARDITDRKRAEENIRLINEQLVEARKAAELANRTKSQFLANMSHEIRTPLNAVIGLNHLLLQTDLSTKQRDYLAKIESSSESLLGIINDILDFSKVESGKLTLEENNFDLEESFQQLGNVITYKANAKGLEVAFGIDSHVPTYLIGDSARLEQILMNLCSNAIKFTDQGEVVINVRMVAEEDDRVNLAFDVRDTGIGMDKTQIGKLFQPFTQADDTISRKYGGTGLGLSIIKRLVELMNGTVGVESEPGLGSRFYFNVWLKRQLHQRKMPTPSVDVRKWSVLLVDDNESARTILHDALTSLSFQVTSVGSAIQAIHYLKNNYHHDPVKLVLMDWKMPVMDGIEAVRLIRADSELGDIKIMMICTSYANEELFKAADDLKISGILVKPIRYSALYDSIVRAIENGKKVIPGEKRADKTPKRTALGSLLLVEDNDINQLVAVELLEGFGFKVEVASNGLEAVQLVEQHAREGHPFELVLMDLQMPVMGGRAATGEIRKLGRHGDLPIIAMTADAMVSVRGECLEAGMNDFISKPINPNTLLATIEKWLQKNRNEQKWRQLHVLPTNGAPDGPEMRLPGVDYKAGLSYVGDNKKLFLELLIMFAKNHEHFIDELNAKLALKASKEAIRMVHSLKGVSGSLGMFRIQELAQNLQTVMADGLENGLTNRIADLDKELTAVRNGINQVKLK